MHVAAASINGIVLRLNESRRSKFALQRNQKMGGAFDFWGMKRVDT
jgi:hypothetical protein